MAAEQLDSLWIDWMDRLSSSYDKTLDLLDDGEVEAARLEFQSNFCSAVKAMYSECEKTYPARFEGIEDWCAWIKGLYTLAAQGVRRSA